MRQLGDLLVCCAVIGILVAVVYFTPRFAQYMSAENQVVQRAEADHGFGLRLIDADAPDR